MKKIVAVILGLCLVAGCSAQAPSTLADVAMSNRIAPNALPAEPTSSAASAEPEKPRDTIDMPEDSGVPEGLYFDMSPEELISVLGKPDSLGDRLEYFYSNKSLYGYEAEYVVTPYESYGLQEFKIIIRGTERDCKKAEKAIRKKLIERFGEHINWSKGALGWVPDDNKDDFYAKPNILLNVIETPLIEDSPYAVTLSFEPKVPVWEENEEKKNKQASEAWEEIAPGVTLENFNRIYTGMSFTDIQYVLGKGTKTGENSAGDRRFTYYEWTNDSGARVWIQFEYSLAISITQTGL